MDTSCEILGASLALPVILAPTALHRMAHPEGELATARAAAAARTILTLSTVSSVPLEDVARAAGGAPLWFQLYQFRDRSLTEDLVARVAAAGYRALVLTVDAPFRGRRERDVRNAFVLPEGVRAAHFGDAFQGLPLTAFITQPATTWKDLAWTRGTLPLPLILKGIVRADDAKRAVEEGVDGIWVSNHGGRQLDTSIPTADALPGIVEAVQGRVPIIVDGGIRRGTDVLKALALGATAAAIGRPLLWGLAAAGEKGVSQVLALLREELALAMALAGCPSLSDIDRSLVAFPR